MSLHNHIEELNRKHRALEREIDTIKATPGVEQVRLNELKRKKLQLKDEIAKLAH